jgi:mono/diheme cytochrome c family protein
MTKFLPVLFLFFFLVSCSGKNESLKVLNPKNLRTQHFVVNPNHDTTLFSLKGGIFKINNGSFEGEGPVDIEIKEAYTPLEILYAGLSTESGGRLLESGGMVFINAKRNGKQIGLRKSIDVSIPTNYVNKEMQLFKGEETQNGDIDWKDPQPLDPVMNRSAIDTGEILFKTSCAGCHSIFKESTGPAMGWLEERVNDRNILREFIRNPQAVMTENAYFNCQKYKYRSLMTAFSNFTDREIDLILDYIKNESAKRPDLKPGGTFNDAIPILKTDSAKKDTTNFYPCMNAPCGFDTIYVDTTNYELTNENMMDLHEEATKEDSMDYLYKNPDSLEKLMRTMGFSDVLPTEGRYNFKIKTLGWFNVDAFYEGMKGTEIVDLFVKSGFEHPEKLEVHVFFPAKKILTVGTFHEEDGLFHFEKYKGQIPLFLNDQAIAFAVTSIKEKLYYGITSFKVTKQQTINLTIKETNEAELTNAFREMKLDNIDLDIITKKRIIVPKPCGQSPPEVR